ncbi:HlyD family type I secretion periplasmic adaptor subunit [Limobrevibacterium gyesilva]|uniref:Membrane fusion protein (MFP) family protein n=1 Tax=Limobrevibacterium gyesilva TaxID=2991712 RepID=A0AA41YMW7_9PROT|nr:HlyD family type I secretion periplasmic adaptor subunit [Limobrevibacterium gyesilva]MCW3476826.1 HlyD family type I secretion periplasmic adaptor subunit [Limobrevibacterium gyesilva]
MAQLPSLRLAAKAPARTTGNGIATAGAGADASDPAAPILLEFESPTAALLARPVPLRSRFVTWIIASMVCVAVGLAWAYPIDRVVTTSGKVISSAPNVVVQPLEVSIVRSIDVKEGQLVHAGDLLARLDPTFAGADAGALESSVASLQAEVDRLSAEQDGRTYLTDGSPPSQLQAVIFTQRHAERAFRLENYAQKIDSLRVKVVQAQSDIDSYSERLAVAKTVEQKRKELERLQVGSQLNTLAAIDNRVEIGRGLETARASLAGSQRDLDAMIAERDGYVQQYRSDTSQQLTEQGRKLAEARENLSKARLRRALVQLRADRDSIVLNVAPVSVGSVMQSGDQLITLVPIDSPLEIETLVDGRDSGFVRVGDPVTIKFETFPYFTYGVARGTVRVVSPDSFSHPMAERDKVTKSRPEQEAGTPFYRTRISIDQMKLHDLPPGFRVTPGMPVTGDIKVGRRTFLQYLMSRVIPPTMEGMREP